MSRDQILVLCYLSAWIITFIFYWKKTKNFNGGSFILSTYILYALCSYLLYGTYYIYFNPLPLTAFPFIYLFVALLLGLLPILKFGSHGYTKLQIPSMKLLNTVSIIFIISTLFDLPSTFSNMVSGMQRMLVDTAAGNDMYTESIENVHNSGSGITNLGAVISNAFAQIGYLLPIYYLTLQKKNKWIFGGLLLACITKMANGISLGQRGGIVEPLLVLTATCFLLKDYIIEKYRRILYIAGSVMVGLITIPVVLITLSRFDNAATDPMASTYYYLGIENINFNNYALDDGGIRYGDRTIPLFKRMIGIDNVPKNFFERRTKYPNLKVNDDTFITYVGDIAIDYGPILGAFIIMLLSRIFLVKTQVRGDTFPFHKLILLHFLLYLCVLGGVKLFPYADAGNLKIILCVFLYFVFKNDYIKQISIKNE